ncbi:MAG: dienelactone hydrolase family protein [Pseudomonadota bacterium]
MRDGTNVEAYVARPPDGRSGPGLVILSEIYNVNHWVREVADGYAEEGFVCLAPDLYWRQRPGQYLEYTPDGQQVARELGFSMDLVAFTADMADYSQSVSALPECTGKVGTVGYCLGGKLAYLAAARRLVDAAVGYYAVQLDQFLDEAGNINRPLMLHFAELDEHVPQATVALVKQALDGNPQVSIYDYEGADHGFNRFGYPPYHPQAASVALERSLAFLREHLS